MEQTIIVMLVLSSIFIIISIYLIKKEDKARKELDTKLDDAFSSINNALDSIEVQSTDFNSTCEMIFREIEEKYQELLLLYSLIEEQKDIAILNKDTENIENDIKETLEKEDTNKIKVDNSFIFKNPKAVEIFKLYDDGMSITEIAKKMGIGKGEVQLMISIRKA